MNTETPIGWYSRGYLPHLDVGSKMQFMTIRLFDSLPQSMLNRFRIELQHRGAENLDLELMRLIEKYLDKGYGACYLKRPEIAEIVKETLLHFDGVRYDMKSWVIMPNHVHFLFLPYEGFRLGKLVQSIKSYSARHSNKAIYRSGEFWFRDFFDRRIRDEEHYRKTIRYIENNPVKAGLCEKPEDWEFGSARERRLVAGNSSVIEDCIL